MIWKNYFFTADFSDCVDFLNRLEAGHQLTSEEASTMAGYFQDHDHRQSKRLLWNAEAGERDYSLFNAQVAYNGTNSAMYATNAKFSHVLILDFSTTAGELPEGKLYLQYNRV